jgi:hypothetical protein
LPPTVSIQNLRGVGENHPDRTRLSIVARMSSQSILHNARVREAAGKIIEMLIKTGVPSGKTARSRCQFPSHPAAIVCATRARKRPSPGTGFDAKRAANGALAALFVFALKTACHRRF